MRFGKRFVPLGTLVVVTVLLSSAIVGGYLVWQEVRSGGMKDRWAYSDTDLAGRSNQYSLLSLSNDEDTILAYETRSMWYDLENMVSLVGLDRNGSLKWRIGINAFPSPHQGPDGRYYYVDWPSGTRGSNGPEAGWRNLTCLDREGNFAWNHEVPNGTIEVGGRTRTAR